MCVFVCVQVLHLSRMVCESGAHSLRFSAYTRGEAGGGSGGPGCSAVILELVNTGMLGGEMFSDVQLQQQGGTAVALDFEDDVSLLLLHVCVFLQGVSFFCVRLFAGQAGAMLFGAAAAPFTWWRRRRRGSAQRQRAV